MKREQSCALLRPARTAVLVMGGDNRKAHPACFLHCLRNTAKPSRCLFFPAVSCAAD